MFSLRGSRILLFHRHSELLKRCLGLRWRLDRGLGGGQDKKDCQHWRSEHLYGYVPTKDQTRRGAPVGNDAIGPRQDQDSALSDERRAVGRGFGGIGGRFEARSQFPPRSSGRCHGKISPKATSPP